MGERKMLATKNKIAIIDQPSIAYKGDDSIMYSWLGEGMRQVALFPALQLFARLVVYGTDNLATGRTYVFAANHYSHLDTPHSLARTTTIWLWNGNLLY